MKEILKYFVQNEFVMRNIIRTFLLMNELQFAPKALESKDLNQHGEVITISQNTNISLEQSSAVSDISSMCSAPGRADIHSTVYKISSQILVCKCLECNLEILA